MSDEDLLDDCAGRIGDLPEPLAVLATSVEVARAEGDTTGVRKRLYDLGACVVRYGVSAGLAVLAARLAGKKAPEPLGASLRKAARLSDGQWCELGRAIASALRSVDPKMAKALGFIAQKPLADLIASNFPQAQASVGDKQEILEAFDVKARVRLVLAMVGRQLEVLRVKKEISSMVQEEMGKSQREYILRQQMKSIREELGEGVGEPDGAVGGGEEVLELLVG